MPTISPGNKVLVTGANGFIAVWIVRTLLERGYVVRGSVRSEEKGRFLKDLFKDYGERFEIVIVRDIAVEGAFNEAVKDVDAIEHTASPVNFGVDDPQELIGPALKGTAGILESAMKYGQHVKRIVITSSTAAIVRTVSTPTVFSEHDWNEESVKEVEDKGRSASVHTKYRASKVLAEKAAWDLYNKNKSELSWDLVVINPPMVYGPSIQDIPSPAALGESMSHWFQTLVSGTIDPEAGSAGSKGGTGWVDVRDLAEGHVRALEREEAAGERIIVCARSFKYQEWMDVINSLDPSRPNLPKGNPKSTDKVYLIQYHSSKAARILGMIPGAEGAGLGLTGERVRYRTMEESARDIIAYFEARGWCPINVD
ncbi:D-lactaldehyde dehydrogenase [Dendrothele bispora CBS 962.96]|uniref:D-lactaldehyde dehydrogenase n=1 Tax=Dendrothele bispora (strain CBS 962.96) TaxID=1314807 RepID=A0A4S8L5X1_DENBC|nr:D-lactaldehyde dehydrogenase [Dendrothele bispora CBS 962.96]